LNASNPHDANGSHFGAPLNWLGIDLVVFDVDGTLYDQRKLRLAMLRELLLDAARSRSLRTLRTLRTFRHVREALGERPGVDFMKLQYTETAQRHDCSPDEIRILATEWLEERPLPFLANTRYPHLDTLFSALRTSGKQVAAFSDYPAVAKLTALGLQASPVVCATDPDIRRLKPDPFGLTAVMQRAGTTPDRTLMIGDRFDRDAAAASAVGVRALIRSSQSHPHVATFQSYDDPIFQPLFASSRVRAAA
jgi:phosphoglycolate phosphatase